MLKIFNTFTKTKEIFIPINKHIVNLYVCGITSYQQCHIGHARTFIIFDIIIKYLLFLGFKINYIRNITDIDDKIINHLNNNHYNNNFPLNLHKYTNKIINETNIIFDKLKLIKPTKEPKVTSNIANIINFIKQLILLGYAYTSYNGDILFNIKKFKKYGTLSNHTYDKINFNNEQINFVIWKMLAPLNYINNHYKNIYWNSPWGKGRPGWHIECSAITNKFIGEYIDIHGGGKDLMFPHHENELAQCEAIYQHPHVKYWIHTGLVNINKKKMSKSLNNYLTIYELLTIYSSEEIKLAFLTTHYRKNFNFCFEKFHTAKTALTSMYLAIRTISNNTTHILLMNNNTSYENNFFSAMNDDFNTPKACAVLFKLTNHINKLNNNKSAEVLALKLKKLANILGLLTYNANDYLQNKYHHKHILINNLILLRNKARKQFNWKMADYLKHKLDRLGIIVEDLAIGSYWRIKNNL